MPKEPFFVRASYKKTEEQKEEELLHRELLGKLEGGESLSDRERESLESLERKNKLES